MSNIPRFKLYGEDDPAFAERIQSKLPLQSWSSLTVEDKANIFQSLFTNLWFEKNQDSLANSLKQLNHRFRRILPAKGISIYSHLTHPTHPPFHNAAIVDFKEIFINSESEDLVLYMVSLFAAGLIKKQTLELAQASEDQDEREIFVILAFERFDMFANQLNHLFEQFSVNIVISRYGMIPRQDDRITEDIYLPTLEVLSDPKWKPINSILMDMFKDYQEHRYPEVITKAHSALHRFLQVALGHDGYSGKGEFGRLFREAQSKNVISNNTEIAPIIKGLNGFLSSERATKSTAKPTDQEASSADALLVMNCCMVLFQHCLQNI